MDYVKRNRQIANSFYNLGLEKANIRDLSGAVDCLKKSLHFDKYQMDARNLLGLIYYEMGEVSGKLADLTIITSDNPRDEEPQEIIDDIKTGIGKTNGKYVEIIDRKEAIAYAIHHGQPGDIVVLAGKGHEDYQEIKGKKYPMDERVLIQEILEEDKQNK